MSLETTVHWIQQLPPMIAFRESTLMYPIVMSLHLSCIAVFGGMVLMTNLRLLGAALKDYPVTAVIAGLRPWKHFGLTVIAAGGLMLATSQGDKYYPNGFFWTKVALLALAAVHAMVFRKSVYRNPDLDQASTMPAAARLAAVSSLVLWTSIAAMGRLIAYWE